MTENAASLMWRRNHSRMEVDTDSIYSTEDKIYEDAIALWKKKKEKEKTVLMDYADVRVLKRFD